MNLKRKLEWRVIYCTLFTNLSSLMLGYYFDVPSPIASEVKSGELLDDYQFGIFSGIFYLSPFSIYQQQLVVSQLYP